MKHLDATFYTDDWKAYQKVIPKEQLVIGKKYTVAIEQNNSNVRHYLARMTRRTKVVSRSEEMVDLSLRLCWFLNEAEGYKKLQEDFLCIFS
jgi:insertion element IS1 protein InsB